MRRYCPEANWDRAVRLAFHQRSRLFDLISCVDEPKSSLHGHLAPGTVVPVLCVLDASMYGLYSAIGRDGASKPYSLWLDCWWKTDVEIAAMRSTDDEGQAWKIDESPARRAVM